MSFNSIDAPGEGNRRARRAIAVIQRKSGAEGRIAAANAKRQRKMDRKFEQDLRRTIVFYAMPSVPDNAVSNQDPDGAYLSAVVNGGQRCVVVVGPLKVSVAHYVKAISLFLKKDFKLVSSDPLPTTFSTDRVFTRIIVEPAE
jgi:hypothetical protein